MPPIKKKILVKPKEYVPLLPTERSAPANKVTDFICCVYGQPGVGKTTFVNDFDEKVLFLSTDRGTRFLSSYTVECLKWETMIKAVTELEKNSSRFGIIAIDHVDDWATMAETFILKKLNVEALTDAGYGKGWDLYKKELRKMVARLKLLCTGIVFIAHEEYKTVKVQGLDVDQCRPKMSKQAWDVIIPLCDLVAYCGIETRKKEGKRIDVRTVTTTPRKDLYTKDRTKRKRVEGSERLDGRSFVETFKG